MSQRPVYGLLAAFKREEHLLRAIRLARAEGYCHIEAYAPIPVEGLREALGYRRTRLPALFLAGGMAGAAGGYFLQWFAMAVDYPLNIGGRPLNSWPMFIPVTFELTVFGAALCGVIGMLAANRFPELYHPVFNAAEFARASQDEFFLCVLSGDPRFDRERTWRFLEGLQPYHLTEVEP